MRGNYRRIADEAVSYAAFIRFISGKKRFRPCRGQEHAYGAAKRLLSSLRDAPSRLGVTFSLNRLIALASGSAAGWHDSGRHEDSGSTPQARFAADPDLHIVTQSIEEVHEPLKISK